MRRTTASGSPATKAWALCITIAAAVLAGNTCADPVTFSGTVTYAGSVSGDSLYVAVLDTVGVEDVTLVDLVAIPVGLSPFAQPYFLSFDNAGLSPELLVAAFLDVDGGGIEDVSGADVFGWYDGNMIPAGIPSAGSQSRLDFALPLAEIHGTVTFAPAQVEARVDVSHDATCMLEGLRPRHFMFSSGSYAIIGIYPGTYCVSADGHDAFGPRHVCHGDPTCANPVLITLTETEVKTGVDLDFTTLVVHGSAWGRVKSLFR